MIHLDFDHYWIVSNYVCIGLLAIYRQPLHCAKTSYMSCHHDWNNMCVVIVTHGALGNKNSHLYLRSNILPSNCLLIICTKTFLKENIYINACLTRVCILLLHITQSLVRDWKNFKRFFCYKFKWFNYNFYM